MFLGKRVIVTDILTDPLWEDDPAPPRACPAARLLVDPNLFGTATNSRVVRDVLHRTASAARRRALT